MEFSSTIRVADLNDYIAPSQDCVVALNGKLRASEVSEEVQLQPRAPPTRGTPGAAGGAPPAPGDPVKVSLHDCLACSGCITSAETVLLQHQSGDEFLARLADPRVAVVVTVSPQSRSALAAYFQLSPSLALSRLAGWFKWLGVRAVWDLTPARDLVLMEEAAEFMDRYRSSREAASCCSGDRPTGQGQDQGQLPPPGPLPVMGSACPGWVCYAEKTHGSRVLPHLSSTRSPQGAMGGLVKSLVAAAWGVTRGSLYHVTVMPCYDKKLEASRDELTTTTAGGSNAAAAEGGSNAMAGGGGGPEERIPEVDCCLTTGEVLALMQQRPAPGCETAGLAAPSAPAAAPDPLLPGVPPDEQLYGMPYGSSSGGYADFVFRTAAREVWGVEVPPGPLPWRIKRNADLQELSLDDVMAATHGTGANGAAPPGQSLCVARVYGFRNIQTLLQQVKRGRCAYHYVEVMACPSGCLNGGGQIKPGPGVTPQQLIEQLEMSYTHSDVAARSPADNPAVAALYGTWLGGRPGAPAARQLLHTTFREREKTVTAAMVANW
ncbi:hypothetical protein PLESTB_001400200 [Pleodorina starrii]|uniref:Iron hydrogenase small subunit domain-containing protein n=1 Tax=Pleodorina starrii TaxID=330485 RepID=A0A9W6BV66_9CHLO|nr:hypothetical protein PLESTM_000532400 [Pleodorina starrii]GLC58778.1 hypothetical protein PLESTB_001400200 [Pleodorina starrii]GLC68710.1 hypothetical protein PLESTF_000727000 [Pleodorina starrii]